MAVELKCVSAYRSDQGGEWPEGKTEAVDDELAEFLLRDSPGSFEIVSSAADAPVGDAPVGGDLVGDLIAGRASEVIERIADCDDADLLAAALLADERKQVQRAIAVRLDELAEGDGDGD